MQHSSDTLSFIGIDTETQDGKAILLCTKNESFFPKSFLSIVNFLRIRGKNFCAYNSDYDVRALIKFLPKKNIEELGVLKRTHYKDYLLTYIPAKFFRISYKGEVIIIIYDCYQFFRLSLNAAAEKYLNEKKVDIPSSWLLNMGYYLKSGKKDIIISYCKKDAELCERLFDIVKEQFQLIGVEFEKPISPGTLALRKFRHRMKSPLTSWQNDFYQKIYLGGRIEVFKRGYFENARIYDINSAYPYALSQFINPHDCIPMDTGKFSRDAKYGIYDIQVYIPLELHASPIPFDIQNKGFFSIPIVYPCGIYRLKVDFYTMKLLEDLNYVDKIYWSREFFSVNNEIWFPEITTLYKERKKRNEIAIAVKLLLNALYGKFAERRYMIVNDIEPSAESLYFRGKFWTTSRWHTDHTNFLVAAHITGYIRAHLYRLMQQAGFTNVIQVHTDSLHVTSGAPSLPVSDELGGLKLEAKPKRLVIVGTGIYAYETETGWTNKFRGFMTRVNLYEQLEGKKKTVVKIPVYRPLSLKEAILHRRIDHMNEFEKENKILDVNFDLKRYWTRPFSSADQVLHVKHGSVPLIGGKF